jgi:hypothetical protein
MTKRQKKSRLMLLSIFAISIIPFLIAWGLKENIQLLSKNTTNKGQLIIPPVPTERVDFATVDTSSTQQMAELPGHWLIVNVIPHKDCNAVCLKALLDTKQLRLMLNKDLLRTRRVVVTFDSMAPALAEQLWLKEALLWRLHSNNGDKTKVNNNPDTALYNALLNPDVKLDDNLVNKLIDQENRDDALQSELIKVTPSAALRKKMADIRKGVIPDGVLFLIDPLGNLMMQYEPGFDPYKVKSDLMQLLRISQIG